MKDIPVVRVRNQIVAGMNFLIYYETSDSLTRFILKIYHSLSGKLELLEAEKNGENIFNSNFEYNFDD